MIGVGAVVWRGNRVLLVRRGQPPRLDQWSLPGGAQEVGETVIEAACREVKEETGLLIENVRLLAVIDLIEPDTEGRIRYHYTLIDVAADAPTGEPTAADDVADVRWFPSEEIESLPIWAETKRVVRLAQQQRQGNGAPLSW